MKIRLLSKQRVIAPAGTEIDIDDGNATLLVEIGAAERIETVKEEPPKKKTRKAAD